MGNGYLYKNNTIQGEHVLKGGNFFLRLKKKNPNKTTPGHKTKQTKQAKYRFLLLLINKFSIEEKCQMFN